MQSQSLDSAQKYTLDYTQNCTLDDAQNCTLESETDRFFAQGMIQKRKAPARNADPRRIAFFLFIMLGQIHNSPF